MRRTWTKEHRERQRAFERRRYPTDLTDEEWERIRPILPEPARCGRKPKVNLREILDAIGYLARASCGWRMLPHKFGPWCVVERTSGRMGYWRCLVRDYSRRCATFKAMFHLSMRRSSLTAYSF